MATINIIIDKPQTPEPLCPATDGDGGEKADTVTTTTTRDITITDPEYVQFFKVLAPDHLNNKAFRVVVAQAMAKTPGCPLFPLAEAGGSVVGAVSEHLMDASTV